MEMSRKNFFLQLLPKTRFLVYNAVAGMFAGRHIRFAEAAHTSGGIPKWLKGLASNTSRSAAPAQGFKSLFLRLRKSLHLQEGCVSAGIFCTSGSARFSQAAARAGASRRFPASAAAPIRASPSLPQGS